ncbi:T9SS type A sorting domain-containing protein [Dyadobacter sp. OTU695]|uniref:T9SS type A sorting domain-containing protein n=1 Tax=Dyadobacter sp. OTU695 TaxID=3043860 RepID=UPI00313DD114
MKTFYLWIWVVLGAISIHSKSHAQCQLVEPAIELNSVSPSGSDCIVNVNLSFTIDKNNGNKYTYVHLWKPTEYPDIDYKKAPKLADLGNVLATLAISTDGSATLLSTYSADEDVIPLFTGLNLIEEDLGSNVYRITIENIQFAVPGACEALPILKGDVWSSQAQSANPPVHCYNEGFNLQINDPVITGKINCNEPDGPRTYDLSIVSTSPTAFEVSYTLYLDDGVLTNGETTFGAGDTPIYTSGPTNLSASQPIQSKEEPYTYGLLEDKRTIWVVLNGPSLPNAIVAELKNGCTITLPVTLARFNGSLLDNAVSLSWTTTEEAGSSHFDIERSTDAREFIQLGRVQAKGNSAATQQYLFVDAKPLAGNNYYRLRMVDLDGKFEYSRTIAVDNGANSVAFELMGNPASTREIKFLLKNENASNVNLYDLSGRAIRFSLSHTGNEFVLKPKNGISSGLYILSLQRSNASTLTRKVLVP